jgi:hypothetical protein
MTESPTAQRPFCTDAAGGVAVGLGRGIAPAGAARVETVDAEAADAEPVADGAAAEEPGEVDGDAESDTAVDEVVGLGEVATDSARGDTCTAALPQPVISATPDTAAAVTRSAWAGRRIGPR